MPAAKIARRRQATAAGKASASVGRPVANRALALDHLDAVHEAGGKPRTRQRAPPSHCPPDRDRQE
eukprot:108301-Alexandrium_andersonii.AAC.1